MNDFFLNICGFDYDMKLFEKENRKYIYYET